MIKKKKTWYPRVHLDESVGRQRQCTMREGMHNGVSRMLYLLNQFTIADVFNCQHLFNYRLLS